MMTPLSQHILQLVTWVAVLLVPYSVLSEEVCCCPSLNLYLTCEEVSMVSKLFDNDYRCVVRQGEDVNLLCQLADADHPAVSGVVYRYYRTGRLSSKVLSSDTSAEEVCASSTDSSSCTMQSVQWKAKEGDLDDDSNMTGGDNHFYQCLAEVTLVDGTTHTILSRTMYLDVVVGPTASPPGNVVTETRNIGFPAIEMDCNLPAANPPTRAVWQYNGVDIDIATDSRVNRLALIEQMDSSDRGKLYVMDFKPEEDNGEYKCYAEYTNLFTGTATKSLVSQYSVQTTGNDNNQAASMETISSVASPTLVKKDGSVEFTAYFSDTSAVVDGVVTPELEYQWYYFNEDIDGRTTWEKVEHGNSYTGDIFDNHATFSNNGRTLTLTGVYKLFSGDGQDTVKFKCRATRTGSDSPFKESSHFEFAYTATQLIIPQEFQVPVTSQTCVSRTDDITTSVNQQLMRIEPKAGVDADAYTQLLVKGKHKFFLNNAELSALVNAPPPVQLTQDVGLTYPADKFAEIFSSLSNNRCLYFQYHGRGPYVIKSAVGYQILETAKVDRSESGCSEISASTCSGATVECGADNSLTVTLSGYSTTQCVAVELRSGDTVVSTRKTFPQVAASCATRSMTLTFAASDLLPESGLTSISRDMVASVVPSYGGKTGCTIALPCGADGSSTTWIIVGVLVGVALIAGVLVLLYFKGLLPWGPGASKKETQGAAVTFSNDSLKKDPAVTLEEGNEISATPSETGVAPDSECPLVEANIYAADTDASPPNDDVTAPADTDASAPADAQPDKTTSQVDV